MKPTRFLMVVALVVLVMSIVQPVRAESQTKTFDLASQRLVFATYLNNWANPEVSEGWDGWEFRSCGVSHYPSNMYQNGTRDVASAYYPLIGAYDAGDEAVMEYHIRLAQASGIDAFIVDWDGIHEFADFSRINTNFIRLLKVAEDMGFSLAIDYDAARYYVGSTTAKNPPWIPDRSHALSAIHDDLSFAIRQFGGSPAYLKSRGKPVVFSFADFALKPAEWEKTTESLTNEGLEAYFVSMNAVLDNYPSFRGFFPWIDAEAIIKHETNSVSFIHDWADRFRTFSVSHQIS